MSIESADFTISITMSAEIAVFRDHETSVAQILNLADDMLYKAKKDGRNRMCLYALQ